jgi:hypothetical protein
VSATLKLMQILREKKATRTNGVCETNVLRAVKMSVVVLLVVMPCRLAGGYQLSRGKYRIHLQG